MGIAAGWYEDGVSAGVERWFDGAGWTEHTRAAAPQGYPPPQGYAPPQGYGYQPGPGYAGGSDLGPGTAAHWLVPVGRSWQSILAGYLGLVGLFVWPLAPVAVGFGIWALRVARDGGHGSGRAVFAIVSGVAGTVIGLIVLASYLGTQ